MMAIAGCKLHLLLVALLIITLVGSRKVATAIADDAFNIEVNPGLDHETGVELQINKVAEGNTFGILHAMSTSADLYTFLTSDQGNNIIELQLKLRGETNISDPFLEDDEREIGSGMRRLTHLSNNTAFFLFRHHAYIAHEDRIIIIALTPNLTQTNTEYQILPFLHTERTIDIKVFDIGQSELYIAVLYKLPNDGKCYVRLFRRYPSGAWAQYGKDRTATTTAWYSDPNLMSNVLLFQNRSPYFNGDSVVMMVGYGYILHVDDITEGTYVAIDTPHPCNVVKHLTYNRHNHLLFIGCHEGSFLYNFTSREMYDHAAELENIAGVPHFSQNGKYGAIVSSVGDGTTNITIIKVRTDSITIFNHLTNSSVAQVAFVHVNSSSRYFCYLEYGEQGKIYCIDVTQTLANLENDPIVQELPNSKGLCPNENSTCPSLYTNHNLLIAQNCTYEDNDCKDGVRIFDLTTFENPWNVTGIEPFFMLWRPIPRPPSPRPPATTTQDVMMTSATSADFEPTTNYQTEAETSSSSSSESPSSITTDSVSTESAFSRTTTTTVTPDGISTSKDGGYSLDVCQRELESSYTAYERLLWITVSVCVLFCIALLITVSLVIAVLCVSRASDNTGSKKEKPKEEHVPALATKTAI